MNFIQRNRKIFTILIIFAILLQLVIINFAVVAGESNNQSEKSIAPKVCSQPRGVRSQYLFFDNFDTGSWDTSKWTRTSSSYVGISTHTSKSGSYSMYFSDNYMATSIHNF